MVQYVVSDRDREVIIAMVQEVAKGRQNRPNFDTQEQMMAPEVYIVEGKVPPRKMDGDAIIPGKKKLPVYKLEPNEAYVPGADIDWKIVPVMLPGNTQLEIEVFNVHECSPDDDYNYAWRDKYGRWQLDFHRCRRRGSGSVS